MAAVQKIITSWDAVPVVFDLPYASRILGLSVATLKKKASLGELPGAVKFAESWLVSKEPLRKFLEGEPRRQ